MQIVQGFESSPPDPHPSVVALGGFDGIHLGHQAILAKALARAAATGLRSTVCTFEPHPRQILQPDRAPAPLTTLGERLELIAATGIDATVVLPFTAALAAVEPESFVADVVLRRLGAREVVVGFNHTFGRRARGNAALLERLGGELGFAVHVVPPLEVDGATVSSSRIRALLQAGDVTVAARLLGRPYWLAGKIVAGAGRGRHLGIPTANLEPERPVLVPAGVYACRATIEGEVHPAVVNVGVRPTFGSGPLAVEAHLIDGFGGDLYGRSMRLGFVARLRDERRFPDVDALRRQIALDIDAARQRLA
jgi:riboflavin kinase/FMN adenylyltransferase